MPTELVFIVVSAIVGGLLVLGVSIAYVREQTLERQSLVVLDEAVAAHEPGDKYLVESGDRIDDAQNGTSERMLRILWWVTIAAVLVGVGLSDSYPNDQATIFGLGGVAALAAVILHEILPRRWRSSATRVVEVGVALALATGLLLLTGYAASPYTFALDLVAVAVALARGGWPAIGVVAVATLAYGGVILADPALSVVEPADLLRIGLNVGSLWLLSGLAGAFAAHERAVRARLNRLWRIDPLTGLFNRAQIYTDLEQEVLRTRRSSRGFSLLMLDLDGLKAVNDRLGHQRGDDVLQAVGRVIRDKIRAVDSAYRYGGDEFLVLLPETDYAGAFVAAEKIRSETEDVGRLLKDEGVQTSVSIGLVSHPEDGSTADELVRAADRAMYNAKALGKNQISGFPRPQHPVAIHIPPPDGGTGGDGTPAEVEPEASSLPHPSRPAPGFGAMTAEPDAQLAIPPPKRPHQRAPETIPERTEDDEPDAAEVRRRIAVASRSFDSDHQIDRAMDVFLSPRIPPAHGDPRPS